MVGQNTFTLTCSSANGGPATASTVTVSVLANDTSSNGNGGGGALPWLTLAPLAGLWWMRRRPQIRANARRSD
jgi:hypothetical protein